MKRDALIRELRTLARRRGVPFEVVHNRGKGSHYRIHFGERSTTLKSGELTNTYVRLVKK